MGPAVLLHIGAVTSLHKSLFSTWLPVGKAPSVKDLATRGKILGVSELVGDRRSRTHTYLSELLRRASHSPIKYGRQRWQGRVLLSTMQYFRTSTLREVLVASSGLV